MQKKSKRSILRKILKATVKAKKNFPAKKTSPVAVCPLKKNISQKVVVNKAESNQKIVITTKSKTQKVVINKFEPNQKIVVSNQASNQKVVVAPQSIQPQISIDQSSNIYTEEFVKIYNSFQINGTNDFKDRVRYDLLKLYGTTTGKNLLLSIIKSNNKIVIAPLDEKHTSPSTAISSQANKNDLYRDSNGNPGKGVNAAVFYNPSGNVNYLNRKDFENVPMAIVLGHELIHAQHAISGTMGTGRVPNDNKRNFWGGEIMEEREEVETAGIPPNNNREFTENKLRSEWETPQPQREYY